MSPANAAGHDPVTVEEVNIAPPPSTDLWPGPVLLTFEDLTTRHGFESGALLCHHASWHRERLGLPHGHPYVDDHELLAEVLRRTLLVKLSPAERAQVQFAQERQADNPVRIDPNADLSGAADAVVFADQEIDDTASELYPALRPCDYRMVEAIGRWRLPHRPALELFIGEEAALVLLAAENVESLEPASVGRETGDRAETVRVMVTEALHLAALACS